MQRTPLRRLRHNISSRFNPNPQLGLETAKEKGTAINGEVEVGLGRQGNVKME